MAKLLTNETSSGAAAGVSLSGPATLIVPNSSVFGGAHIRVEISVVDTTGDYVPVEIRFDSAGVVPLDIVGTYFARAVVYGATATTDLTLDAIQ